MAINIKPQNYWAIHDAFVLQKDERVSGTKLIALNKLIQAKGELLNFADKQIKALSLGNGTFIAMDVQHYKKNSFFPCRVTKYHLQKL
jgi:hypothetical protein